MGRRELETSAQSSLIGHFPRKKGEKVPYRRKKAAPPWKKEKRPQHGESNDVASGQSWASQIREKRLETEEKTLDRVPAEHHEEKSRCLKQKDREREGDRQSGALDRPRQTALWK